MKRPYFILAACILLTILSFAAVSLARTYKMAEAGYAYQFPRDHASHSDYKTEWWYYTGHLTTEGGKKYGYELTFFRSGNPLDKAPKSDWKLDEIYPAHFAISDISTRKFYVSDKLNRAGVAWAGADDSVLNVWNETWSLEQLGDAFVLHADDADHSLKLMLTSDKSPVIHGEIGISQKASCNGCASHYYSMTRLKSVGLLSQTDKQGKAVFQRVTGESWMDHEFGSNQLAQNQTGWDWFSIQLSDNSEVMVYQLRTQDGNRHGIDPNSSATIIRPDGTSHHLKVSDIQLSVSKYWVSPQTKGNYPMGWKLTVPSEKLELELTPEFENQELVTDKSTNVAYWEGATRVKGVKGGKSVSGKAYVELVGYAGRFKQRI